MARSIKRPNPDVKLPDAELVSMADYYGVLQGRHSLGVTLIRTKPKVKGKAAKKAAKRLRHLHG